MRSLSAESVTLAPSRSPTDLGAVEHLELCHIVRVGRGDGTLLGMMNEAVRYKVPVVGIRHGKLGFLATFSPEEMEDSLLAQLGN